MGYSVVVTGVSRRRTSVNLGGMTKAADSRYGNPRPREVRRSDESERRYPSRRVSLTEHDIGQTGVGHAGRAAPERRACVVPPTGSTRKAAAISLAAACWVKFDIVATLLQVSRPLVRWQTDTVTWLASCTRGYRRPGSGTNYFPRNFEGSLQLALMFVRVTAVGGELPFNQTATSIDVRPAPDLARPARPAPARRSAPASSARRRAPAPSARSSAGARSAIATSVASENTT